MPSTRKSSEGNAAEEVAKTPSRVTKGSRFAKKVPTKKVLAQKVPKKKMPTKGQSERLASWDYTHNLPSSTERSKNGRVHGRTLINWTRPRMMEKAFLHLMYESEVRNIELPLDAVAHRLYPGATGEALRQRFHRLRKEMIAEGHLVPPKAGKKRTNLNPKIRGHIRKFPGDPENILETREVLFTEPIDDAEFNDPTGFLLVHNASARTKITKVTAVAEQDESDANHNSDSQSTDEPQESDQETEVHLESRSSASARTRFLDQRNFHVDSDDEEHDPLLGQEEYPLNYSENPLGHVDNRLPDRQLMPATHRQPAEFPASARAARMGTDFVSASGQALPQGIMPSATFVGPYNPVFGSNANPWYFWGRQYNTHDYGQTLHEQQMQPIHPLVPMYHAAPVEDQDFNQIITDAPASDHGLPSSTEEFQSSQHGVKEMPNMDQFFTSEH
ncbi:hypothetical protein SCUP515_05983 [Seiridium cupressi]